MTIPFRNVVTYGATLPTRLNRPPKNSVMTNLSASPDAVDLSKTLTIDENASRNGPVSTSSNSFEMLSFRRVNCAPISSAFFSATAPNF